MSVFCWLRIWYPWENFAMFIGVCLLLLRILSTGKCTVPLEKHLRIIAFLKNTYINLQCCRNRVESTLKNYLVIKINDQTWLKLWLIALVTTIYTCSIWGNVYIFMLVTFFHAKEFCIRVYLLLYIITARNCVRFDSIFFKRFSF